MKTYAELKEGAKASQAEVDHLKKQKVGTPVINMKDKEVPNSLMLGNRTYIAKNPHGYELISYTFMNERESFHLSADELKQLKKYRG